jgi:hypothetical protein
LGWFQPGNWPGFLPPTGPGRKVPWKVSPSTPSVAGRPSDVRFLRPRQVEAIYALSCKFLAHARGRGDGPPFSKPSGRLVLYAVADVEAWLAAHRLSSTSDAGE